MHNVQCITVQCKPRLSNVHFVAFPLFILLLPVDKILLLQVLHCRGDLSGHVKQHDGVDLLAVTLAQVVQQVTVGHELGNDVERRLPRTNTLDNNI